MSKSNPPPRYGPTEDLKHIDLTGVFKNVRLKVEPPAPRPAQHGAFGVSFHDQFMTITDGRGYAFVATLLKDAQGMQASQLDKTLPRDLKALASIANDPATPIEWRAKMLEVIVYRGAINEFSYDGMSRQGISASDRSVLEKHGLVVERLDEFTERRAYQEAARDTVFRDPTVFGQMSRSEDQLPQGRSAATEFMNSMLKNGGIYGNHAARQDFETKLKEFPAEARGAAMYHLLDAGHRSEVHLKGEKRVTGEGWDLSIDTGHGGLGVGYSQSWDHVANNHWQDVGGDITREMRSDMNGRPSAYQDAHEKGFKEAAARDRGW